MKDKLKQTLIDAAAFVVIGVTIAAAVEVVNWPLYFLSAVMTGIMLSIYQNRGYKAACKDFEGFADEYNSMVKEALDKAVAMRDEARATLEATRKIAGEGIGGA